MFCTENKQTKGGSRTPRSSMMELFVTMEVISYWQSSSNLDDGGIVELPLYAIIFSFHNKIGIMEEGKDQENSSISYIGTFFIFSVRGIQFLLPLLTNSCSLIDPFVFWGFYKVLFESIPLFWKYSNNLQECSKPGNFSFWNTKSFQPSILIKKTVSKHQSRGK